MKKALVTLTVGDRYILNYKKYSYDSWVKYAQNNNLDLVVIENVIDESQRAQSRSPAWQKCLITSHEDVKKYDQVAWIDSDILINPASPNVFENVPIEMIGAVDAYATPNREDARISSERLSEFWSKKGVDFVNDTTATGYHKSYGLDGNFQSIVQTGVLVLTPKYHTSLLEHVYNNYEDKGGGHWNYEMRPLSYEILKNNMAHWLNPKFNMPWPYIKQFIYPFLNNTSDLNNMSDNYIHKSINKVLRKSGLIAKSSSSLESKCATTAFLNNYFLHFAGCADEMKYVNQDITSIFDI
jgi:hypothetical protein